MSDTHAESEPTCYNCSRPPVPGRRWCRECMNQNLAGTIRWRVKQLAAGNCIRCARPNPDDGLRKRCPDCRAKQNARSRARYWAKRAGRRPGASDGTEGGS